MSNSIRQILLKVESDVHQRLAAKTGWGRNEIKSLLNEVIQGAISANASCDPSPSDVIRSKLDTIASRSKREMVNVDYPPGYFRDE